MSHLDESINVNHHRDLERAVINEYGRVTIEGDFGKKVADLYDTKFYEGGVTMTDDFINAETESVLENQNIWFILMPLIPGFNLSRNDLREYSDEKKGDTVVLIHNRNQLS